MTHQVNLNRQSLLPGYGPVQLPSFIITLLLAVAAASIWIALSWSERQSLLTEEAELIQQLALEQQRLESFQRQNPNVSNEPELRAENQTLNERLQRARETYSGLANQLENSVEGFHQPLTQLSDYDLEGLWLSQIRLQDGQRRFALTGFARDPELIPQYLEQLGKSSFRGISIQHFDLNKQDDQQLWQFNLSNTPSDNTGGTR